MCWPSVGAGRGWKVSTPGSSYGGPGTATSLLSYLVYLEGFRVLNFGYASAIAMLLFFIVLIVGVLGYGLLRRAWERL